MIRNSDSTSSFVMDNSYASLMMRLRMPDHGNNGCPKVIGIMGIDSTEEARKVAASVAYAAAHDLGDRTLLVDLAGGANDLFGVPNGGPVPGWTEVVAEQCSLDECIRSDPDVDRLFLLPRGTGSLTMRPANFSNAVATLNELRSAYDFIVVLLSPVSNSTTPAIASRLDGNLLVIESERTHVDRAKQAQNILQDSHARTLGVVLCNWQDHTPAWWGRRR